jgi:hypothetical protein
MDPVIVEVVAPMLSGNILACRSCSVIFKQSGFEDVNKKYCLEEYPPDFREGAAKLADCLGELSRLYKHRISFRMIDPMSPLGIWKQLRHRVFRTPAFIVDRRLTCTGLDTLKLEALIDERLNAGSHKLA